MNAIDELKRELLGHVVTRDGYQSQHERQRSQVAAIEALETSINKTVRYLDAEMDGAAGNDLFEAACLIVSQRDNARNEAEVYKDQVAELERKLAAESASRLETQRLLVKMICDNVDQGKASRHNMTTDDYNTLNAAIAWTESTAMYPSSK